KAVRASSMSAPFRATSHQTYHRRRVRLIGLLPAAVAVWAVMRWRPFRVEVAGPSMEPALFAGDWVLATAGGRIEQGDVVVIRHPERPGIEMVKRVSGMSGDQVRAGRVLGPGQ